MKRDEVRGWIKRHTRTFHFSFSSGFLMPPLILLAEGKICMWNNVTWHDIKYVSKRVLFSFLCAHTISGWPRTRKEKHFFYSCVLLLCFLFSTQTMSLPPFNLTSINTSCSIYIFSEFLRPVNKGSHHVPFFVLFYAPLVK